MKNFALVALALAVAHAQFLGYESGPVLKPCSGFNNICTILKDTFSPYPIVPGDKDDVKLTVKCSEHLTSGEVKIKVLGQTIASFKVDQDVPAGKATEIEQSVVIPNMHLPIHHVTAEADVYDQNGKEVACYKGEIDLSSTQVEEEVYGDSIVLTPCSDSNVISLKDVTFSPSPLPKSGGTVDASATVTSSKDLTKGHIDISVLGVNVVTIELEQAIKANTPTPISRKKNVPGIGISGNFPATFKAYDVNLGEVGCFKGTLPVGSVQAEEEMYGDGPALTLCSGSPTTCKLVSDSFSPYPIKKGSSETVSIVVNCDKDVTVKDIQIKALGTTVIDLQEGVSCKANTDCTLTAKADVPSIPFITSINAQAISYDNSGNELVCYEGKIDLKGSIFEEQAAF